MTAALAFALRNWKVVLSGFVVLGLSIALLVARGDARHWEKVADGFEKQIEVAKRQAAEQAAANQKRLADATADYAAREAARQPLIVRSTNTVREYAQTSAGGAPCLAPARLRGIDDLDASLATGTPGGGPGTVHPDAGP